MARIWHPLFQSDPALLQCNVTFYLHLLGPNLSIFVLSPRLFHDSDSSVSWINSLSGLSLFEAIVNSNSDVEALVNIEHVALIEEVFVYRLKQVDIRLADEHTHFIASVSEQQKHE